MLGSPGQPLDGGCVGEDFRAYGDAVAAVVEFLRPYPEVSRCSAESYWLARRSRDADLAVWVWVECHAFEGSDKGRQRVAAAEAADRACSIDNAGRRFSSEGFFPKL